MDYPRSRSRPRGDYSPRDEFFNDRTHRSKSLDYRRGNWSEEDDFQDRDPRLRHSQPQLNRGPDYSRGPGPESPRREHQIETRRQDYFDTPRRPDLNRSRELARSQEWYPSPQQQHRERYQPPSPNDSRQKWRPFSQGRGEYAPRQHQRPNISPRSEVSAKPLKITTTNRPARGFFGGGGRRDEESPRSIGYPAPGYQQPPREPRDPGYRYQDRGMEVATIGGGGGGGYSRSYNHQSYHQGHSGAATGGMSTASGRRAVSMQPMGAAPSWKHGPGAPPRYRRVQCCCLTFTWPPWSVEPAQPPQPIYRNI